MTAGSLEDQMSALRFVIILLALAAGFMVARYLIPHVISGVAYYVAVALCGIALFGAVVGIVRG